MRGLDDPAPEVRFRCIYALVGKDDERVLPKLRVIAATDTAECRGMWASRLEALWAIQLASTRPRRTLRQEALWASSGSSLAATATPGRSEPTNTAPLP